MEWSQSGTEPNQVFNLPAFTFMKDGMAVWRFLE